MIRLGELEMDPAFTTVSERREWRDTACLRTARVNGLATGHADAQKREAWLDRVWAAAEGDGVSPVALSLRPGRVLWVRPVRLAREGHHRTPDGAFTLDFAAVDPREEAGTESMVPWPITTRDAETVLFSHGTAPAPLTIAFTAGDDILWPSFGDGTRTLRYQGMMAAGQTLTLDGAARKVLLDGLDVTAQCSGEFPGPLCAGEFTLRYRDDLDSSHTGHAVVRWRDLWW